jgi:hypothetical protein
MTHLELDGAEVGVIASALHRERDQVSKVRAISERHLADAEDDGINWASFACMHEKDLATLDGLVRKLPSWVALYMGAAR